MATPLDNLEKRTNELDVRTAVIAVSQAKDFSASQTALELTAKQLAQRLDKLDYETERLKSFSDNLLGKQSVVTYLVAAVLSFLISKYLK